MAQFQIANLAQFLKSLEDARKSVSDLSIPFAEIRLDWMRTNRLLFQQGGSGPWADLGSKGSRSKVRGFGPKKTGEGDGKLAGYKLAKQKRWGFVYPILKASGRLEKSLTEPEDANSLFELLNNRSLRIGTKAVNEKGVAYPKFLNDGTKFMPARPFMAVPEISQRRWVKILRDYVLAELSPPGAPAAAQKKR